MPTYIDTTNLSPATIATLQGPVITQIQITDSSYNVLDDTAVSTSGGYITITGSNFTAGTQVVIGTVAASSVTFINSTTLNVQVPAQSAGTYVVYVTTNTGSVAIMVNGLTYSGTPTWVTGSTLTGGQVDTPISIQLSATGDAPITYTLAAGSSLPPGLSLSSAGLISGTVTGVTSETTYNFTVNAADAEAQDSPRTFSITITANDQYFDYVTTLLSASTPASTFVSDASTNNFAVTVFGDTRPSNFGPYTPGYYSNYFDGTGDYLSVPTNQSALAMGSSDFTIEAWVYKITSGLAFVFCGQTDAQTVGGSAYGLYVTDTAATSDVYIGGTGYGVTSPNPTLNTWAHVAFVRTGGTLSTYLNGTRVGTRSDLGSGSINAGATTYPPSIGGTGFGSNLTGYISNLRIIKGSGGYNATQATITVPTAPLTVTANTSLLTCQSNRLIDNSTNNFAITRNGDVRVDSFDPFLPDTNFAGRGSGFFDGTTDYLLLPNSTPLTLAGSDYTLEAWIYVTGIPDYGMIIGKRGSVGGSREYQLYLNHPDRILSCSDSAGNNYNSSQAIPLNVWSHVAMSVVGSSTNATARLFYNGALVYTTTSFNNSIPRTSDITIGSLTDGQSFQGYITDARIVKGTAVYTTTFTPPTTPLTAIANTQLLTLQNNQPNNNRMFLDSSTSNFTITRNGNTTQGSFSPYGGGWSNYFDGNGDSLSYTGGSSLNFGTGDFTIETWAYLTNTGTFSAFLRPDETGTFPEWGYDFSSGQLKFDARSGAIVATTTTMPTNQWVHVAVSRSGTSLRQFINGTQVGSTTTNSTNFGSTTGTIRIGGSGFSASHSVNGYLSNFRVVVGTAVYTTNFTPPTAPLTPIANTSLLTCADNRFIDDSPNNFAITRNGDVSIQRFNPFNPVITTPTSYSGFFDGTGDYLIVADNAALQMGSGDFTVEFWWYPTSITSPAFQTPFDKGYTSAGGLLLQTGNGNGIIVVYASGSTVITASTAVNVNAWNHMALVRNSTTLTLYLNGVSVGSATNSTNFNATNAVGIGANSSGGLGVGSYPINGYMSNMRVVKGTAVYTSAFTPSTTPLTAIANTSLLTLQSPTFVDNSTNNFTITANGDTSPRQFNPFGWTSTTGGSAAYTPALYGGSGYFDGTGDYLSASSASTGFGTGDFTLELWAYKTGSGTAVLTNVEGGTNNNYFAIDVVNANAQIQIRDDAGQSFAYGPALVNNCWNHIAVTRASGSVRVFVNGVSGTPVTITRSVTSRPAIVGAFLYSTFEGYFTGYISDVRITKGVARYTSNFVPPVAPLTAQQNTVLLNNMTGAGIYDSSMMANYETVGNSSISTSLKKYGNTSMYFDGSGDYLSAADSPVFEVGSADFTIEAWIYVVSYVSTSAIVQKGAAGAYSPYLIYIGGSSEISFYSSTNGSNWAISDLRIATNPATNTWHHIAVTRSGTTFRTFFNGALANSITLSGSLLNNSGPLLVGYYTASFNGYIDDLRITNGVARYTSTFTPPASPVIRF